MSLPGGTPGRRAAMSRPGRRESSVARGARSRGLYYRTQGALISVSAPSYPPRAVRIAARISFEPTMTSKLATIRPSDPTTKTKGSKGMP